MLKEIKDLDKQVEDHEYQTNKTDQQQKDLLKSVHQEPQVLDLQWKKLTQELTGENEQKMNQVRKIEGSVDEGRGHSNCHVNLVT